ncbi:MAG: hypothetical protein NC215_01700 [Ruminococcus sp.]|nr:hypothetical protein [Ruminococcus sp.]MCM1391939.1 hypothetical protein [Ruminococcus sp.]
MAICKICKNTTEQIYNIQVGSLICDMACSDCKHMIESLNDESSADYKDNVIRAKRVLTLPGEKNKYHYEIYLQMTKDGRYIWQLI